MVFFSLWRTFNVVDKGGDGNLTPLCHATVFAETNCQPCISQKHGKVLYLRWTVHTASEFRERSGPKLVHAPEGKAKAQGKRERERGRVSERPGAPEGKS